MQRKRLFAFGDSFTKYSWPMWPDILAQNFEEAYNYGNPGTGNTCIFSYLTFILDYEKISKDDTVIVQWSEPMRVDCITDNAGDWVNAGSESTEEFVRKGLKKYIDDDFVHFMHLTQMSAAIDLLEKTGCEWYFIFLNKHAISHKKFKKFKFDNHLNKQVYFLLEKISRHVDKIIDISIVDFVKQNKLRQFTECWITNGKKQTKNTFVDEHPLPQVTYQFIKNVLSQNMKNLELNKMKNYVDEIEKIMQPMGPPYNQDQVFYEIFEHHLQNNIKNAKCGQSKLIFDEKI